MNKTISLMALNESELNLKHYQLMKELLEEFNDSIHLIDMTLLVPHQQNLLTFMKNELIGLQQKMRKKMEKIIQTYEQLSKILIAQYNQVLILVY